MPSVNVAYNNPAVAGFGSFLGSAMNTGFRNNPGPTFSYYEFFFTGTNSVELNGGLYLTGTNQLIVTIMTTGGSVLNTIDPFSQPGFTGSSLSVQNISYTAGLNPAVTYRCQLKFAGSGGQIMQSDAMIQLTGSSGTPTLSAVTGWDPSRIYQFSSSYNNATPIQSVIGLEGNATIGNVAGVTCWQSGSQALGTNRNGAMMRFKANCTAIWAKLYEASAGTIHLQSVALNGSSGIPTSIASASTDGSSSYGNWHLIASGLTATDTLYELTSQCGSGGGFLIAGLMIVGGTGLDFTTTTASLTRTKQLAFIGDSRAQQNLPSQTPWTYSLAQVQQNQNKQMINAGVDGEALQVISASSTRYTEVAQGTAPTVGIVIDGGINDIKSGTPPTVLQLNGYLTTLINKIRSVSGFSTVKIYVEAIKPYSGMTYAAIHAFNVGYQSTVAAFNAGTAAGQSPSPDTNVFYMDTEAWNLAGTAWKTGGSFDATNFADGLHLNQTGYNVEYTKLLTELNIANTIIAPVVSLGSVTTTTINLTATAASGGTAPYTYQWYRSTTSGFTPGGGNILAGKTSLSLADTGLSPSTTYYYVITATDASPATANSAQQTAATASPGALTAGSITVNSVTSTSINLSVSSASNGTPPYTYQWYRSTSSGFTPGGGNIVSGATSTTLNDTGLASATTYYYKNIVTDSAAATSTTAEASGVTGAAVTSGTASVVSVGSTTASLNVATATGGTSPYTYQWYRSTTNGFTPGGGNIIAGATTRSLGDSGLSPTTTYYYKNVVTDAGSATSTSNQVNLTTTIPGAFTVGQLMSVGVSVELAKYLVLGAVTISGLCELGMPSQQAGIYAAGGATVHDLMAFGMPWQLAKLIGN